MLYFAIGIEESLNVSFHLLYHSVDSTHIFLEILIIHERLFFFSEDEVGYQGNSCNFCLAVVMPYHE